MQKTLQPNNIKPKLILAAILAAYAMPQLAVAEDKEKAIELGKIEVVSTTPLPGVGLPANEISANVQVVKDEELQQQNSLTYS